MMNIGCVILAGGKSTRMGRDKANLEFQGQTFIKKLAQELDFFEEKMIARGPNEGFEGMDWTIIPDLHEECGPIGGLHSALKNCKSEALFCLPCDIPLMETSLFHWLVPFLEEKYDAVVCMTPDGKRHPLSGIYWKSSAAVLEEQISNGDNRMMSALDKLKVKYVVVDSKSKEDQLFNVNTPQDYRRLKEYCE